jgi:uncharacterized repeat protein (TIGR01451 family)
MNHTVRLLAIGAAVLACLAGAPQAAASSGVRVTIVRIDAPDAVAVRLPSGTVTEVHLTGVRAPEAGACLGDAALAYTKHVAVPGASALLTVDRTQAGPGDGSLAGYLAPHDGGDLGRALLRRGLARVAYPRPFARLYGYRRDERAARAGPRGLWAICSDVEVSVSLAPSTVTAGNTVAFLVKVTNRGPGVARDVRVKASLPVGVFVQPLGVTPCSDTEPAVCPIGELVSPPLRRRQVELPTERTSSEFRLFATAGPAAAVTQAEFTASTASIDTNAENNHASATLAITAGTASADLSLSVTGPPGLEFGKPAIFTATVTNNGPTEAIAPILSAVDLCSGLPCSSIRLIPSDGIQNWSCASRPLPCSLASGETATVRWADDSGFPGPRLFGITALTPDPQPSNNNQTLTVGYPPLLSWADLAVDLSADRTSVGVGDPVKHTITVSNHGPNTADGVVLVVTELLDDAAVDAVSPSQGSCDRTLVCELGSLAADETATVEVVARPKGDWPEGISVCATVSSSTPDPYLDGGSVDFGHGLVPTANRSCNTMEVLPAPAPQAVIRSDQKVGPLLLSSKTGIAATSAAFGPPLQERLYAEFCDFEYLDLRMTFFAPLSKNPCTAGRFRQAAVFGRRWHTTRGLRVGDTLASLRRLYPAAVAHDHDWWLVPRMSVSGRYGGLVAVVRKGHVTALVVNARGAPLR